MAIHRYALSFHYLCIPVMGLPRRCSGKKAACQCRRCRFNPWVRKMSLDEEVATHSSMLAWKVPWTEEPGRLWPMRSQRVRHDLSTHTSPLHPCNIFLFRKPLWKSVKCTKVLNHMVILPLHCPNLVIWVRKMKFEKVDFPQSLRLQVSRNSNLGMTFWVHPQKFWISLQHLDQ